MDVIVQPFRLTLMLIFMVVVTVCTCVPMALSRCIYHLVPKRFTTVRSSLIYLGEVNGWLWSKASLFAIDSMSKIEWQVTGTEKIPHDKSCIIISNHSSWFDIPAVFKAMIGTGVVVRFFVKRALLLLPFFGQAAWGIFCPFMRRHSKAYLEKHPEKAGQDIAETKRSCDVFRGRHVYLLNYVEGTRYTEEKRLKQKAPYNNLLKPRAGGVANALQAMDGQIEKIIDLTISYPEGKPDFLTFVSGKRFVARLHVEVLDLPDVGSGDYTGDPESRAKYQSWVNELWSSKDGRFESRSKLEAA